MRNKSVVIEEAPAAPALTPDLVAQLKKEDMKQAIVERFRGSSESAAARSAKRPGKRSPYWRPADEEC
ncbi:MAG: hypothetical protein WA655_21555 [Candidatus Korobacteraceae bacterium]